jgi:hypothetical protein
VVGGIGISVTLAIRLDASGAGGADNKIQAKVKTSKLMVTTTAPINTLGVNRRSNSIFMLALPKKKG